MSKEHNLSDDMIKSVLHVFKRQVLQQFPDVDKNLYDTLRDIYGGKSKLQPSLFRTLKGIKYEGGRTSTYY